MMAEVADLDGASLEAVVGERTRLVAVTAASNLVGTIPSLTRVAQAGIGRGAPSTSTTHMRQPP